jgi:hypothetical protein
VSRSSTTGAAGGSGRIAPIRATARKVGGEARRELRVVHEQAGLDVELLAALGEVG